MLALTPAVAVIELDMALTDSPSWDSAQPQVLGLATHSRLPLSTLSLSSISLRTLKVLHLSLLSIRSPQTCTLWWLLLQAGHMAGRPLGDIPHPCFMVLRQAGVYGAPALKGRSVGGMVVQRSTSIFLHGTA